MNSYLAAIDFGSTKIVTIVGEKTDSGVRIVFYRDAPLPAGISIENGEIINDMTVIETLRPTIEAAEREIGEDIDEAIVSISGKLIESKSITNTFCRANPQEHISEEDLKIISNKVLSAENDADNMVYDIIPQEYNVDDHIGFLQIVGMKGTSVETLFKLFKGKKSLITTREAVLNNFGIKIKGAVLSPIASARATLNDLEMENGVALVDIGGGSTDIAIIRENTVREVAIIPFGGESITTDIKQVAAITYNWAELVKIRHGFCVEEDTPENKKLILKSDIGDVEGEVEVRTLSQIIEARMSEIFEAVRYVIQQSGYSNKIPSGVVLTGGGCYMESIIDLAKVILQCKVRLAAPRASITSDSDDNSFDAYSSTAVGLILEGFDRKLSHIEYSEMYETAPAKAESTRQFNNNLFGEEEDIKEKEYAKTKDAGRTKVRKEPAVKEKRTFTGIFGNIFSEDNDKA